MSKHIVDQKATMVFTPVAFAKMTMLIQGFESEVAWHGIAKRDDKDSTKFIISDILVYPQYVSGGTVNTDQDAYEKWLNGLDDETFNNLRMQGHSHVNFGTSPSGVDTTHREKLVEQLEPDMFYIFLIWNKKFEHTNLIYDMTCNTLYEDRDITVAIGEEGVNLDEFIKSAKEVATRKVYVPSTPAYGNYVGSQKKDDAKPAASASNDKKSDTKSDKKEEKKPDKKKEDKSDIKTKPKSAGAYDKPQLGSSQYASRAPANASADTYRGYAGYGNYGGYDSGYCYGYGD